MRWIIIGKYNFNLAETLRLLKRILTTPCLTVGDKFFKFKKNKKLILLLSERKRRFKKRRNLIMGE